MRLIASINANSAPTKRARCCASAATPGATTSRARAAWPRFLNVQEHTETYSTRDSSRNAACTLRRAGTPRSDTASCARGCRLLHQARRPRARQPRQGGRDRMVSLPRVQCARRAIRGHASDNRHVELRAGHAGRQARQAWRARHSRGNREQDLSNLQTRLPRWKEQAPARLTCALPMEARTARPIAGGPARLRNRNHR